MKRFIFLPVCFILMLFTNVNVYAQIPIAEIIKEAVKKVIVAADLEIQRLQTQTIYLQEAQKQLENLMAQTELGEITDWVQRQKDLYQDYYQELWQVKNVLSYYQRVKDLIDKEARLVNDYKKAYALVRQDNHFSAGELIQIFKVYDGILAESIRNIGQLGLVINAFVTQMSDADRLKIINGAADRIDRNYSALQGFTQENILVSLQRSRDQNDLDQVRSLYGIK